MAVSFVCSAVVYIIYGNNDSRHKTDMVAVKTTMHKAFQNHQWENIRKEIC